MSIINYPIRWYLSGNFEWLKHDFYPTHMRFSPWVVGVITGYIFHKTRSKTISISRVINFVAWILTLAMINVCVFGLYPFEQTISTNTPLEHGLFAGLTRVGWAIAICYVIFACHHNYGGPVNWFLGSALWQPLSRLSYSMYLIHFLVLSLTSGTIKYPLYVSELFCFMYAVAIYVLTAFVSIVVSLAFESPIPYIETLIFDSKQKPATKRCDTEN